MARITGIGGIFFTTEDPKATVQWYAEHLGLQPEPWGGHVFHWRLSENGDKRGYSVWSPFALDAAKFADSDQPFMVNYRVDDLEGMLARLRAAGVRVVGELEEHPNGKFAWIVDPSGRKVELWEPVDSDVDPYL